jgi:starvation-inducible DNA-binding protein
MALRARQLTRQALDKIAAWLQPFLADLIALSLQGKEAHWNVVGPLFPLVHAQMDQVVDHAREWADDVAERMVALGIPAAGQACDVARGSSLLPLPDGILSDRDAVALIAEQVAILASRGRTAMEQLADVDLVSQDLVIEIVRGLEKDLWMLRAQIEKPTGEETSLGIVAVA